AWPTAERHRAWDASSPTPAAETLQRRTPPGASAPSRAIFTEGLTEPTWLLTGRPSMLDDEGHHAPMEDKSMGTHDLSTKGMLAAAAALAFFVIAVAWQASSAKTPDDMPPSQEQVCSGLQGAAFGLCNAYCEAQDCDVHP